MGTCAQLFYSSDSSKETLTSRISLSSEQDDLQRDKHKKVFEYLKVGLSRIYPQEAQWLPRLQGSVQYGTQIRPMAINDEYDIDLGVYALQQKDATEFSDDAANYKANIQELLLEYLDIDDDAKEVMNPDKKFCCRLHFVGNFHVDIVAYHQNTDEDIRLAATKHGEWVNTDPKKIYDWFKNTVSDVTHRVRMRRMIKYLKCWAALHFDGDNDSKPSSIYLTILCANSYKKLARTGAITDNDDECLYALLNDICSHVSPLYEPYEENPVDPTENICRISITHWDAFKSKLTSFLRTAQLANSAAPIESPLLWGVAFKHFMPQPSESVLNSTTLPALWNIPDVEIIANHQTANRRNVKVNAVGPIGKSFDLHFKVQNPSAFPVDARVKWTIRNHGAEAGTQNDLGHENEETGLYESIQENTAYNGIHYVDCVIFSDSNGSLYGYRRVPVNIQDSSHLRNPRSIPRGPRR
ncbi:MAG: hypothetical protein ACI9TY_000640 [Alphaproteobacteria bacterium]|jgi:hypothetical protein